MSDYSKLGPLPGIIENRNQDLQFLKKLSQSQDGIKKLDSKSRKALSSILKKFETCKNPKERGDALKGLRDRISTPEQKPAKPGKGESASKWSLARFGFKFSAKGITQRIMGTPRSKDILKRADRVAKQLERDIAPAVRTARFEKIVSERPKVTKQLAKVRDDLVAKRAALSEAVANEATTEGLPNKKAELEERLQAATQKLKLAESKLEGLKGPKERQPIETEVRLAKESINTINDDLRDIAGAEADAFLNQQILPEGMVLPTEAEKLEQTIGYLEGQEEELQTKLSDLDVIERELLFDGAEEEDIERFGELEKGVQQMGADLETNKKRLAEIGALITELQTAVGDAEVVLQDSAYAKSEALKEKQQIKKDQREQVSLDKRQKKQDLSQTKATKKERAERAAAKQAKIDALVDQMEGADGSQAKRGRLGAAKRLGGKVAQAAKKKSGQAAGWAKEKGTRAKDAFVEGGKTLARKPGEKLQSAKIRQQEKEIKKLEAARIAGKTTPEANLSRIQLKLEQDKERLKELKETLPKQKKAVFTSNSMLEKQQSELTTLRKKLKEAPPPEST